MLHDTKIGTSNQDVTNEDTTVKWWTKREQMKKRKTSALAFRAPTERCYSWYSKCVTTSIYSSSEIFSIPWSSHRHWVRGWLTAATLGQDDGNFQETAVSHAVWLSENHMYTRARPTSEPPPRAVPSPSFCRLLIQQQQSLLDARCCCATIDKCQRGRWYLGRCREAALNHPIWVGGGQRNQTEAVKQAVRELPSCHHKSLAGQRAVAEIIPQLVLLLTVRGMRNQAQQCVCGCARARERERGGGPSLLKTCQMPGDLISVSFSQWATAQWPCQRQKAEERDTPLESCTINF